jgi:hypothetical protein
VPRVIVVGPYKFFFFSNESGEPAHIHVRRDRNVAKFWLQPVALASSGRFSARELRDIERIVSEHAHQLLESWHEHFGR